MPEEKSTSAEKPVVGADKNTPGTGTHSAQDRLRGSLARANKAVGAILVASLLLTLIAVVAGLRSTRSLYRAEQAEAKSRERLWNAYLAQARAARLSGVIGRRAEALTAISNAAALHVSKDVRDEAIASHVLTDLILESEICTVPLDEPLVEFSAGLEKYAMGGNEGGDFTIYRTSDRSKLHRLNRVAAGLGPIPGRDRRTGQYLFSPDGNYFALSLLDGGLAVWELAKGQVVFQYSPTASGPIGMDFSQDSTRFGFHDLDRARDLATIALPSGKISQQMVPLTGAPFAFQPDPNHLVIAVENELRIVRADTGEILKKVSTPEAIMSVQASPDGRKIAASCRGTDLYLWNLESRQLYVLRSHTERNSTLEFSPASDRLMSSSLDNVTCLWDCSSGRELVRATECNGLDFSRDGQRLGCVLERRKLAVYGLAGGTALRTLAGHGSRDQQFIRFDLSPDGRWLAAILDEGLEIWDLHSGQPGNFFPMADARALTFLPDGKSLLLARVGTGLERIAIQVVPSVENSTPIVQLGPRQTVPAPEGISIRHLTVSSNGRTACLDLNDLRMMVIDLESERKPVVLSKTGRMTFRVGPGSATGSGRFAISPDGHWIAVGYGPATQPVVFDAHTGDVVTELSTGAGTVVFSHDGRWLLTGGGNEYSLWRVADWKPVWQRTFEALGRQWGCMSFSGDDRWVALTLDRHRIGLLDVLTGEILSTLTSPDPQTIAGIRIAHNNNRVVAGTFNNLAQVWDLAALREELAPLGFDCSTPLPAQPPALLAAVPGVPGSATVITSGLVATACLGALTLAVLRRHRRVAEEFVQAEAQASESERELQMQRELNRLKSNFVSMVSHEYRTPLGLIQSSAEILQAYFEQLGPERRAEHLADIVQSTTRMKDLMEEVLLLSRVESGRMECKPDSVDLRALARRLAAEVEASSGNRCPIQVETSALYGVAHIDESLVTIILSNLLSNAVKYSRPGAPVLLSIRREQLEIIFEIRDRGIGIPRDDQTYLFKSFHRASNVGQIPGTGLGLTIVKRCTELHNGTISFTSAEGHETTFIVRLPI